MTTLLNRLARSLLPTKAKAPAGGARPGPAAPVADERLLLELDLDGAAASQPDPVIGLAADGAVAHLNPAASRLLELAASAARGRGFVEECVSSGDRYRVAAALQARRPEYLAFKVRAASGAETMLSALLLPATQGGGCVILARPLAGGEPRQAVSVTLPESGTLVTEVSRLLSVAPPECFGDTLTGVLERIGRAFAADRVFLVPQEEFAQRHDYAGSGWAAAAMPAEGRWRGRRQAWLWHALREGRVLLREDGDPPPGAEQRELLLALGTRAVACVPLVTEGRLLGALVMESIDGQVTWEQPQRRQLDLLAAILASALVRHLRERELAEERARLLEAQSLASLGYWDWEPQADRLQCSGNALAIFRAAAPGMASGRDWLLEQVHADERERLAASLAALADGDQQFDAQFRLAVEVAAPLWVRLQACWGRAADGSRRVRGNVIDITPLKRREQEVLAAHARLEHLIDSAPLVVYVLQPGAQRHAPIFYSDNAGKLFGYQRDEMLRPGWWESRIHEADVGAAVRAREALLRDGHASVEYRLRDARGDYRWIFDEATVIRDAQGRPSEVVGLWLDITDKRRIEAAVRESEARYRALVEDSPTLICRLSGDLRLQFVNATCADYFGLDSTAMSGASWLDYVFPDDRGGYLERVHQLSPESPVVSYEQRVVLPSGEVRWQFWSDRGFFENGELVEIQSVGRDTTELRETRAKLAHAAKMATIGALATGVAHELNQPLNVMRLAIGNMLNRAANNTLDAEFVQSKLARIERQVGRASNIVDQMRIFGRKSSKTPEAFDPGTPVDGALDLLREQLQKQDVTVDWRPLAGARRALGFPDQVEQVVINLLVNARDAIVARREASGEDFPGRIAVRLEDAVEADTLALVVHDNGGGIPEHVIENIFDPFFTTKEVGKGTGLGLSLSFGMLQDMGGGIAVRNVDGGAEFRISLPPAQASADKAEYTNDKVAARTGAA